MADPNLEAMSIDELDALSVELKAEQFAIKARRRELLQERTRKVFVQRIRNEIGRSPLAKAAMDAGLFVIADDLPFERAAEILALVRQSRTPNDGDVTVTPDTAVLRAIPGGLDDGGAA